MIESIRRLAISILPLSFETNTRCRQDRAPLVARRDGPSARRGKFSRKAGASALLHFLGELTHGFLRDHAAFPARKRCLAIIEREKKCRALAFAFFPQSQSFLHRIFFGVQPPAFNGPACERLLVCGEPYVNRLQITRNHLF